MKELLTLNAHLLTPQPGGASVVTADRRYSDNGTTDGEVWKAGNKVGDITVNGEVWREDNVEADGTIWINGVRQGWLKGGELAQAAAILNFGFLAFKERQAGH